MAFLIDWRPTSPCIRYYQIEKTLIHPSSQPRTPIEAVIFDAFGTLIQLNPVQVRRHPYRELMKWLRDQGRRPCTSDPRDILTQDLEIGGIAKYFGGNPEPDLVQQWEESLEVELKSIQLFEDSLTVLQSLKARGLRRGLCSNLAKPYARAIDRLLPNVWDFRALSFELGIIKPESGMYTFCLQGLQLPSESVLFIGDSVINDYVAPRKQGMKSLLIDRNDKISKYQSISSLMQLLESL